MLMKRLSGAVLLAAAVCLCPIASAKLIGYDLTLEVTQEFHQESCGFPSAINDVFRCDVAIGETFVGSFFIDHELLSREGDALVSPIYDFVLPFAGLVYDQNLPVFGINGSSFNGFYGPQVDGGPASFNAIAPGFDVHAGALTDLYGGVYGISDNPYVDFSLFGPNTFFAIDVHNTTISGTLAVSRNGQVIPEPATYALLGIALAGFGVARRRNRSP
jgi:hypothetical protein